MNWKGKKVLVTGAGGFIGSHLTEKLVSLGAEVRALVHYNSVGSWGWLDHSSVKESIEVVSGDICDRDVVGRCMENREIVFHLAALIAIPYSYLAPTSYVRVNVEGTLNVVESARREGVERVVHTSTSEVYGTAQYVPIDEKHPLQGQSPYSASKIGADKIAEAFHLSFGVPVVTVRPFNTFGPRQSARAVIPTIITQCLARKTVKLGSLHPTRDFNYVANTVDGFIAAAASPDVLGRTFNVGTGREISIGNLARMIVDLVGNGTEIVSDDERVRPGASEVERLLADSEAAQGQLAWKPTVGLEEGLGRTIDWIRENMDVYRPDLYSV